MYRDNLVINLENKSAASAIPVSGRITAMWGLSEAALGGLLHALRIPFTGLFIGGAAVIFISLIAYYSENRRAIIKSTLIVILIKATVSPHTPLTAYFAVMIQGILGYMLFEYTRSYKLPAFFLGLLSLILSAVQKLIILTLVFGENLWESIDLFFNFILEQVFPIDRGMNDIRLSRVLIGLYFTIHLAGGIAAGVVAGIIPEWIENKLKDTGGRGFNRNIESRLSNPKSNGKRNWYKKKTGIFLISFSVLLGISSYLFPDLGEGTAAGLLVMLIRAVVILILWYSLISPILLKLFNVYLKKQKNKYSIEVNSIINLLPLMKAIVNYSWESAKSQSGLKRLKSFLSHTLVFMLVADTGSSDL